MSAPRQTPHRSKQDYATPPVFIAAVLARLGIPAFAIDLAADALNTKAETFLTAADDALTVPHWERLIGSGWGWLNPPFARIKPWARRCVETRAAGGQVALLVPMAAADWCRDYVHGQARVLLLNGRIAFVGCDGAATKDCMLALYQVFHLLQFAWRWRDVFDQLSRLLVRDPDVAAMATVVVNARVFAQGRQLPAQLTLAPWALRDRGHDWRNSHHPSASVSALLGNSRTGRRPTATVRERVTASEEVA